MKVEFTNDSWWSSNGCDCCEPDYMECYNVIPINERCAGLWSAHSKGACYEQAFYISGLWSEEMFNKESGWHTLPQLRKLAKEHNLEVVIGNRED